jgi:hypothetical protein
VARVPVRQWSALTRDIVALVLNYCRRHVLHGWGHVDRVEGGVEVVFRKVQCEERGVTGVREAMLLTPTPQERGGP